MDLREHGNEPSSSLKTGSLFTSQGTTNFSKILHNGVK